MVVEEILTPLWRKIDVRGSREERAERREQRAEELALSTSIGDLFRRLNRAPGTLRILSESEYHFLSLPRAMFRDTLTAGIPLSEPTTQIDLPTTYVCSRGVPSG